MRYLIIIVHFLESVTERTLNIGQYLMKLCVEYWGVTFLAHSVCFSLDSRDSVLFYSRLSGVCQPEGCFGLLVFFLSFFIKRISVKNGQRCLAPYIWQDVGPDWEVRVRKFQTYPSRGFSRGSEKLSKKYAFSDLDNFRSKMLSIENAL